MADYTELVEELRYCIDGDKECASCKRWGQMACDVYLMEEAADAIEDLEKKVTEWQEEACKWNNEYFSLRDSKSRWIHVTERLPEKDGWYLVMLGTGIVEQAEYVYYGSGAYKWYEKMNSIPVRVVVPKFWYPLPEPPKEEQI